MSNNHFLNGLSPLEEDFMRALWQVGKGEISDAIPLMEQSETPYTTIASVVSKLESKGYVARVGKRRGHVYAPEVTQEEYYGKTIKYVVSNFFKGSYKSLVQHFAEEEVVSKEDIEEILSLIERGEDK